MALMVPMEKQAHKARKVIQDRKVRKVIQELPGREENRVQKEIQVHKDYKARKAKPVKKVMSDPRDQ
jgi:RNA polymerase-interacting CarD/CdnL/TRCF family regulator